MYKNKKILALIPARGGSKGLPGKNVLPLLGEPLIAWTVKQALTSKYIDKVVVSTDSPEIARIARSYGANIPFLRPSELSSDEATSIDAIIHALDFLNNNGFAPDYLVLLEPTSPLREVKDIDCNIEVLIDNKIAKSLVTVAKLECSHPEFNVVIDSSTGFIRKMDGGVNFNVLRRQRLQEVFFFEGTIYISDVKTLYCKRTFYHESTLACVVPRWKSLEIDELPDFICAEALLKARLEKKF